MTHSSCGNPFLACLLPEWGRQVCRGAAPNVSLGALPCERNQLSLGTHLVPGAGLGASRA